MVALFGCLATYYIDGKGLFQPVSETISSGEEGESMYVYLGAHVVGSDARAALNSTADITHRTGHPARSRHSVRVVTQE